MFRLRPIATIKAARPIFIIHEEEECIHSKRKKKKKKKRKKKKKERERDRVCVCVCVCVSNLYSRRRLPA